MTNHLDNQQVERAVNALVKHVSTKIKHKEKQQLIESDEDFFVVFALKKIPEKNRVKPIKIALPHPLFSNTGKDICLFTKDPQREYKELVKSLNLGEISKVIGVTKLRQKYKPYEAKRALCNSYDLFLADDRIIPMLPRLIGKKFFEKKKQPIPIRLSKARESLTAEIEKAIRSTTLHLSAGACISVRFANTSHSVKEIAENLFSAVENSVERFPSKWKNVQSIHIKSSSSIALPIYNTLPIVADSVVASPPSSIKSESKQDGKKDTKSMKVSNEKSSLDKGENRSTRKTIVKSANVAKIESPKLVAKKKTGAPKRKAL